MGLMCQPLPKSQGTHLYLYVVASISYVVDIFFSGSKVAWSTISDTKTTPMNPAKAQQPQQREVLRQEQALRVRSLLAVVDRHEDLLEEVNPLRLLPRFSTHRQAMSHRYFRKVGAQLYRQVSRVITFEKEILI